MNECCTRITDHYEVKIVRVLPKLQHITTVPTSHRSAEENFTNSNFAQAGHCERAQELPYSYLALMGFLYSSQWNLCKLCVWRKDLICDCTNNLPNREAHDGKWDCWWAHSQMSTWACLQKKQDLYGFTSSSVAVVPDFIKSKVQYFLQKNWFRRHCQSTYCSPFSSSLIAGFYDYRYIFNHITKPYMASTPIGLLRTHCWCNFWGSWILCQCWLQSS